MPWKNIALKPSLTGSHQTREIYKWNQENRRQQVKMGRSQWKGAAYSSGYKYSEKEQTTATLIKYKTAYIDYQ